MSNESRQHTKVVGIGLNKTGTKTLGHYLARWGYRHRSYDSNSTHESPSFTLYSQGNTAALMDIVRDYDSFEDWPWPLLYRQIDDQFEDVKFVLTTRSSSEVWYRSLCNMAVRIGAMPLYEKSVYGYATPQGHKAEFVARYETHNTEVAAHFKERPDDLLTLCWENGDNAQTLATFLGLTDVDTTPLHSNRSPSNVYSGDNPLLARAHRLHYKLLGAPGSFGRRAISAVKRRLPGGH